MLPFRSEIRNSPSHPTIKIFLSDETLVPRVKKHLEHFEDIEYSEIRKTHGRNREEDNITVFLKDHVDINKLKSSIDSSLWWYFEEDMVE
ncbi:hypothetical protein JJL45_00785 [Tamlana sp. s12]|uniref:hypothetical protein n=1 Tax=Flavobacteriaceae TaxID=49546 RepID=UPI0007FFA83C|nr:MULTISPECIES: hypothetical protein [Tamlana]OBQ57247.1 hypothetical protein VQ01_01880 [Tamlana sp. s12]QQY82563.1 hypothetical protein JJL45_00785 [Tamlana sp. s12]